MVWRHCPNVVLVPGNLMTPKTAGRFAERRRNRHSIPVPAYNKGILSLQQETVSKI